MPSVKITINKDADIHLDYIGFQGVDCNIAEQEIKEKLKRLKLKNSGENIKEKFEDRMMELE